MFVAWLCNKNLNPYLIKNNIYCHAWLLEYTPLNNHKTKQFQSRLDYPVRCLTTNFPFKKKQELRKQEKNLIVWTIKYLCLIISITHLSIFVTINVINEKSFEPVVILWHILTKQVGCWFIGYFMVIFVYLIMFIDRKYRKRINSVDVVLWNVCQIKISVIIRTMTSQYEGRKDEQYSYTDRRKERVKFCKRNCTDFGLFSQIYSLILFMAAEDFSKTKVSN